MPVEPGQLRMMRDGTVASYPLLRDAQRAVAEASQNARRAAVHPCPLCSRRHG